MAMANRRFQRGFDAWPGYVDVLSTLLMVIIFILMLFVIAQFFLTDALSGRDRALNRLNQQIAELTDLLALEQSASDELRVNLAELSAELQASIGQRDTLAAQIAELDDAHREEMSKLLADIAALESLRDELADKLLTTETDSERQLSAQEQLTEEAQRQVELLNRQLLALRQQLARLAVSLEAAEAEAVEKDVQIVDLGRRLNIALAGKVEELARYRSEFFGRLREILGEREDIAIVGDRFVFKSDVLFESASAELGFEGQRQIAGIADALLQISAEIPPEIDWVLRVDGHTDRRPIRSTIYDSNWELSTARAISVVEYLIARGLPPERLAAGGFGEFQPLDTGDSEEALQRNRRIELRLDQR
ncbi:MAG: peptidoglycan -binding protein [Dongiaceae bacterium]